MGGVDESVGFNLTGTDSAIVGLLDGARARLPEQAGKLRALVTARIAGARYDSGDVETAQALSSEALELARSTGDARAVAVALAVRHTALSRPESLDERLELDDELRALGRPFSVQAEVWRIGDLLECGRMAEADLAMADLESGALVRARSRAHAGTPRCTGAMRAQVRGDLAAASASCEEARRRGEQIGARTAGVTYAVQSLFIARERRELGGLIELLDTLAAEHPHQPGFVTTATWVRVETGRLDEAREPFERLGADGFASIPRNGVWLPSMRLLTDIAYEVGEPAHSAALYELLLPYRDRCIVASRVLTFLGSVEHALGLLALRTGELDRAEDHLGRARVRHAELGATLLTARVDIALAALQRCTGRHRRSTGPADPGPRARRAARLGRRRARRHPEGFLSEHTFASMTVACCTSGRCWVRANPRSIRTRRSREFRSAPTTLPPVGLTVDTTVGSTCRASGSVARIRCSTR